MYLFLTNDAGKVHSNKSCHANDPFSSPLRKALVHTIHKLTMITPIQNSQIRVVLSQG